MSAKNKFPYYGVLVDIDLSPEGRFSLYRYLIQALFGAIFFMIFIGLFILIFACYYSGDKVAGNFFWLIPTSIASSIFLVFGSPGVPTARPRPVIVGQIIGIFCGWLGFYSIKLLNTLALVFPQELILSIGFSMFLSLFLMTVFDSEHPPAAGTAIALTLFEYETSSLFSVSLFVCFIALCLGLISYYCYKSDGLKAIIGVDNRALKTLKKNGILTLKHLKTSKMKTLENIFKDKKECYNFESWIEQAGKEPLISDTNNLQFLKDLF